MKRILLLIPLLGLLCSGIYSQTLTDPSLTEDVIRCYSVEYHEFRKSSNPGIPSTEDFEKTLAAQMEAAMTDETNNGILKGVLQIPVIVHVVHFGEPVGTGPNIAAEQVYSQIEVMNEDFRRMLGTRGYNDDPRGADVEIEFVPALVDPEGNLLKEPGIHRYQGPLPAYVLEDIELLIKPATIYDPNRYLNLWTVNFAALLLGYAQFPDPAHGLAFGVGCDTGGSNTDGVVQLYSAFGSREKYPEGTYTANYDLGRTVTHEVGHWMGLRHIWGDGGCGVDDYCGDTPMAAASNSGCPTGIVSCGSIDMIENYMDYTYDACMNIFTNDQALRMRTVMTKSPRRRELLSSTVHLQPVALDAAIIDIASPKGERCNSNVLPEVLLRNLGQSTLNTVAINYQVDGGDVQTYQWNGSLGTGDIEIVTLPAISTTEGTHTLTVYTTSPNGSTDAYAHNDQWSDEFIVSSIGEKLDFLEAFESGLYPPSNKWDIQNPDFCESWSPYSNITGPDGTLTTGAFLNYYNYDATGTTDGLVLPLINLSTTEDAALEFDVAYASSGEAQDRLEVFISVDCGLTFKNIYSKSGADLATAPEADGAFLPGAPEQWRREVLNLNNYRSSQVLIKFVGTNAYGNNIFVDNIYVSGASDNAEPIELKKFTASKTDKGVELQWVTSAEENYLHFELERSPDGESFIYAQTIDVKKGTSSGASYKTLDAEPYSGNNFYRLKIVRDYGLNPLYSQTISLKSNNTGSNARIADIGQEALKATGIYPNPASDYFELNYEALMDGEVEVELIDVMGKVVYTGRLQSQEGHNQAKISTVDLPSGVYAIVIHHAGGITKEKIIIQ
ncbi:M43 family zinc metalloprotease [Nafulsella turpanensis]|uniref:M43 family zinc metalloprotease n=1 Tax=Nafulsella turpanensis TaxID=1265690 RepID=UPI00058D557D|nr:M43 family zinc metalloprotease [Nafulsella turpanensis]